VVVGDRTMFTTVYVILIVVADIYVSSELQEVPARKADEIRGKIPL